MEARCLQRILSAGPSQPTAATTIQVAHSGSFKSATRRLTSRQQIFANLRPILLARKCREGPGRYRTSSPYLTGKPTRSTTTARTGMDCLRPSHCRQAGRKDGGGGHKTRGGGG